ncbi:sacsin-like [Acanthaster planci]|uniref:Sacsin-like n=1 Tax=Acanthaster planci TaxID=133434 RepID=A0A8B7XID8_ACAPL|nr:sacsin-like [Acanthaster planci]
MEDFSDEDDDFGQKLPPLHIYIKRVLDKYPEGGQILKELVQNADDAEAKNVIFLYDKSRHPDCQLWSDTLRDFQGPALYAYNDATFQKEDWKNIQHPEQSGKLEDLTKVGRFGLGFISVYHLTDMPSVISGKQLGFLDPLEKHFIYDPHTNTRYMGRRGKKWKMSADLLAKFPDQFSPYLIDLFHCSKTNFHNGNLDGTIFRFPLRTSASLISKSVFADQRRVYELLASFQADAEISLLFLKHVESISIYERDSYLECPRLTCKVQISQSDRQKIQSSKATFLGQILSRQDIQTESCVRIEKQGGQQAIVKTSEYITINILKNRRPSSHMQALINDEDLKLLPWMGMSFQISAAGLAAEQQTGRVFCFLPLPESETTGLPVHIHGYFGLGDNRRSIKWPDRESQHDNKALWNKLLLEEVFPELYAKVVLAAVRKSKDPGNPIKPVDVYRGWPSIGRVNGAWLAGVKKFLQLMANEDIFYTEYNGGSWMKPSTNIYVDPEGSTLISKVLRYKGCPVAQPPEHVLESLEWAGAHYKKVTPAVVRNAIRGDSLQFLSRNEKMQLLKYVSSDGISDLGNLCLLPLQSGEFIAFHHNAQRVYIATNENPISLIPNGGSRFAASDLPSELTISGVGTCTQLEYLTIHDVAPLLKEILPVTWRAGSDDTLIWTPGIDQQPKEEWLKELWNWMAKTYPTSDIEVFKGIPLIPVPHNRLARLQKGRLISREKRQSYPCFSLKCLSDNICSFLESAGAVVLRQDVPKYISCHPHIDRFISPPTAAGVLTILEICSRKMNLVRCIERSATGTKDELRTLFAQLQPSTSQQSDILKELPIFLGSDGQYVSVRMCATAVPSDYFGLPVKTLRYRCLVLRSDESDSLLSRLGVCSQSLEDILQSSVLPAVQDEFYSVSDSLRIMAWVLERPQFDNLVTDVAFVPSVVFKARPNELFEPTRTLQVIFRGESVFPTGRYSEGRLLNNLKRVGLKNEADITPDDVLRCATDISQTQGRGQADIERGSVLLEHIKRNVHILRRTVTKNRICKALYKFLEDLFWVPCETSPPANYPSSAGWKGNSNTLYTPRQVGLIETALVQGSVLPLVNLGDTGVELRNVFGWNKELDPSNYQHLERVILHLRNASTKFQVGHESVFVLSKTMSEIYLFLQKAAIAQLRHLFDSHLAIAYPWVWHGSGFTTPDKMALSHGTLGVTLTPYLRVVPEDFLKFRDFLIAMGVQESFQESALCEVLQNIQQKHQGTLVSDEQEYKTDLNIVCNILKHIVSQDKCHVDRSSILVPCREPSGWGRRLHMANSSECLYVDEERLARQLFREGAQDLDKQIIHELVPNWIAHKLELQPLSHVIAPVEAVEYGYEVTGPHETTVNAIKRNLEMYKEGPGIFIEMIQNADDAGATEVKFLLDWRRNEQTAHDLLGEGMKACHGPAVWAYNDACFSKDDITNICNIAAQSKKYQLDKVGRFGLGFTSVYHLTDVPSVVSGPYVLICDPRTIHLGSRVQPNQPGIKLDLTNERHKQTLRSYPNQFQPYNDIFGCKLLETAKFDHTLFRLPLRTKAEADGQQLNQISDSVCDSRNSIEPLLASLQKSASTLLLFTQNVIHVSVHELQSENVNDVKTLMSVNISSFHQLPRSISSQTGNLAPERSILKATAACMKGDDPRQPLPETTQIVNVALETLASGRGAKKKPKKTTCHFIVSSCMVSGKCLQLAHTKDGIKAGVLPCGGVAAKLVSGEKGLTPETTHGKAFSFLPLDVSTGLGFHVNGNFLLQPNRRQLWSKPSSDTGEFESRWNIGFMESVLVQAFINLMKDLQVLQEQSMVDARNFQCLWPRRNKTESDFHPFVDAFYKIVGSSSDAPAVIFNQSRWVSVHECFFTNWSPNDPEDLKRSIKTLLNKDQYPKQCVELEKDVVSSIKQADANKFFDGNTFSIERFLSEVFFSMLKDKPDDIESVHRNRIVIHTLDLRLGERKVGDYDGLLSTTECIPCSPEGEDLLSPKDLVNPTTPVGSLYSETDCRFPHGELYRKEERLLSLSQLGMASDDLPWDDICERAESLAKGENVDQRCKTLLKLMDEKLRSHEPTVDQKRRLQEAAFLPVMKKPAEYPIDWCQCGDDYMSAEQLHVPEHKNLLGSVQPLLDEKKLGSDAMSQNIKALLGFTEKRVDVGDAIAQLAIVINQAHEGVHQISGMVGSIYAYLQNKLCALSQSGDVTVKQGHSAHVEQLRSLKFVFFDSKFKECKQLAFQYRGRSGPYLYGVPHGLTQFSNLLRICGVRDNFHVDDFVQALQLLKDTYGEKPLSELDVKTAKSVLSEIVSLMAEGHNGNSQSSLLESSLHNRLIFVPDNQRILRSLHELIYNDMEWEGGLSEEIYTHPDISYRDAKVLGIVTKRQKYIDNYSSSQEFQIDFGQSEELTDRLKSILRAYPNVSDVFKELLQNADDAGATEIHFVYDPRYHETKKVVCDSWSAVGKVPSLCVYNDVPFTEADIKGIQKVGVGGKRDDIATTGKFGIGFNAVYHLTDCPSFLSNSDTLCVFDPLLKISPITQKISPGKQFRAGNQFREKFPDMLRGYLEDITAFSEKTGTVFRFPLRAQPSDISVEVYPEDRVLELLGDFKKVSQESLFFLNNIKTIIVSCVNKQTHEIQTEYCISAELSEQDEEGRKRLRDHLKLFKNNPSLTVEPVSQVYTVEIKDSLGTKQNWLVSQMVGFEGSALECQSTPRVPTIKKPVPRGGVAALLKDGGVATSDNQLCKAYCFLPLPVHTSLPVHVNGTFELDSARKNLAKRDDYATSDTSTEEGAFIHKWNKILVEHVIAPAYARLIERAGKIITRQTKGKNSFKDQLQLYDELFPKDLKKYQGEWSLLAKATLRYISSENMQVLPVVRQMGDPLTVTWHHPNSDTSFAYTDDLGAAGNVEGDMEGLSGTEQFLMRSFLLRVGFNLLASSSTLCLAFRDCGVKAEFVNPKAVVQHLLSGSRVAETLPAPLKKTKFQNIKTLQTLFDYCLAGIKEPAELNGLPLLLTNDDTLREFSTRDGYYVTIHARVLPNLKDKFLHNQLVSSCIAWFKKNENTEKAFNSGIFKQFTVPELAKNLRKHLPEYWEGCGRHVEWAPDKNGHPSKSWLGHLWSFICSETVQKESSLECISQWPIFPTTASKLVPPSLSKTILYLENLEIGFGMKTAKALRKLCLPVISHSLMCEPRLTHYGGAPMQVPHTPVGLVELLKKHLALPNSQQDVAGVIKYVLETVGRVGELLFEECDTLLHYFQEDEALSEDSIKTIKKLSIFKRVEGKQTTDLHHFEFYHTAESNLLLKVEAETWMQHMHCVILEPNRSLNLIHDKLGITPITQADMYLKYILPSFTVLSGKAKLDHVKFIRDKVLLNASEQDGKVILEHLSHTPFIPDKKGILRQAGFFYDSDNLVFKAMIDPIKLLPESMGTLKYFLEKIGFHSGVTKDEFLRFARDIETRAEKVKDKKKREKLCSISSVLTNELKLNEELRDPDFLKTVATIKFIPSVPVSKELLHIHPACSGNYQGCSFIAYKGSVSQRYLKLVWSVCMVLPNRAIPMDVTIEKGVTVHGCLGIETESVADKVITHTQNICGLLEQKNAVHKDDTLTEEEREKFKDIVDEILRYLTGLDVTKYGAQIERRLQNTPICLVEDRRILVRADQLVFHMEKRLQTCLRPYLFEAPRDLAQFDVLLRLLGAQRSCSFDQLAVVLSSLHAECGEDRLSPNEWETAVGAFRAMLLFLDRANGQCETSITELYVPSSKGFLRKATDLYYANLTQMGKFKLSSTDREFIVPIKQCRILDKDEVSLIELIPRHLRPKNLGDEMNAKPLDTNEDCPARQHCEYLESIKRKVNSEEMTRVLLRLKQHQQEDKQPSKEIIERIVQLQQFNKLVCKTELKLGLYDKKGRKIAERKYTLKAYFDAQTGIVHLEHGSLPISKERSLTFGQIASSCNALLGGILNSHHESLCARSLDCHSLDEMNTILSKSDIPEYDIRGLTTKAIQPDEYRLGSLIPADIHHLLDQDPYNRFNENEIVAYERSIEERDQSRTSESDSLALGSGEWMPSDSTPVNAATEKIYAKILEQIDKDAQVRLRRRYRIDIGEKDPIVVKVTALYKFLRPKKQPVTSVIHFTGESTDEAPAANFESALPEHMQEDEEQIKREVEEVFSLPPEERRRVLKRLYRKWHPDKNPGQQERANKAFQFLKQAIEMREKGNQSGRSCSDQYSSWESEVERDREEATRYQERYHQSRHSARSSASDSYFVPPSFTRETPDPRKARLWFRQAQEHFQSAELTSKQRPVQSQWVAFQVHQAAETALKAAQYSLDGRPDTSVNDLVCLARAVCRHKDVTSDQLLDITLELVSLDCHFSKPRYPQNGNSQTSGQEYRHFSTYNVLKKCEELLNLVQDIIGIRVF